MSTNKTIAVWHHADFDGICSGAIAKRFFGDKADSLGWSYGEPVPDLSQYDKVVLMDLSFPKADMDHNASKLLWIDHHKSAIAENDPSIRGLRIDGVAASRLTYQWFYGDFTHSKADYVDRTVKEPYGVRLLGEYDIWDKRDENTDPFQVGLQAEKVPDWDSILNDKRGYIDQIVANGEVIQQYLKVTNAEISKQRGFDMEFEGLKFRVLNNARSNSLTFEAALDETHDGCMSYHWDGKAWKFSLYGNEKKKGVDLSVIAKKYGGGGHAGAAGFSLKQNDLPSGLGGRIDGI